MDRATNLKDLWLCQIMPIKMFSDVLGFTPAATKAFLAETGSHTFTIAGVVWVKPIDIAHAARAWKPVGGGPDDHRG